ncbi:MAG: 50S ribosomal protein L40e [Candidatus Diapherotrites archaeon]|nr:50S ribosomal protein L40e [Candidatus Diapherotrites archaeon]
MALTPEATERRFNNVWICMKCNAKNKGSTGKKPHTCRKCGSKRLRLKRKPKKV